MEWALDHTEEILSLAWRHVLYSGLPLVIGLLVSLPVGWFAVRVPRLQGLVLTTTGLLFTIPSLALFILMPLIIGTQILDPLNVVVAMSIYTVALLVRTVVDGLSAVPEHVEQSANAMGYSTVRRFFAVELPLAVPVIAAGLRVAAVSNVSIVSVASLIGVAQLGNLLTDGFNRNIQSELMTGIVACILLALAFDVLIQVGTFVLTPWRRAERATA
jgi:osmoprotectant transport system permease protein